MSKRQNKFINQNKGENMKNLKYAVLSFMIILLLSSLSYPQMRDRDTRDGMREMVKKKLQLTSEQEKKINDLRLIHKERLIDLTSELKKKELQKEKILSGDVIDRNQLIKITNEIGEIKNRIMTERINHQMDVYENLDANQKIIWKDMMLKGDRMKKEMMLGMRDNMKDKMMNRNKANR